MYIFQGLYEEKCIICTRQYDGSKKSQLKYPLEEYNQLLTEDSFLVQLTETTGFCKSCQMSLTSRLTRKRRRTYFLPTVADKLIVSNSNYSNLGISYILHKPPFPHRGILLAL